MNGEDYRTYLTECIKTAGQMLIEMADDIVGNTDCISHLSIDIDFDELNAASVPEITISRSHVPDREKLNYLLDIRDQNRKREDKDTRNELFSW